MMLTRLACHCLKACDTTLKHYSITGLYLQSSFCFLRQGLTKFILLMMILNSLRQLWNFYPLALVLVIEIYRAVPPGLTQSTPNTHNKAYVSKYIRVLRYFLCVSLIVAAMSPGWNVLLPPSLCSVFLLQVIHQLFIYILSFIRPNFSSLSWHVSYPNLLYKVISIISSQLSYSICVENFAAIFGHITLFCGLLIFGTDKYWQN